MQVLIILFKKYFIYIFRTLILILVIMLQIYMLNSRISFGASPDDKKNNNDNLKSEAQLNRLCLVSLTKNLNLPGTPTDEIKHYFTEWKKILLNFSLQSQDIKIESQVAAKNFLVPWEKKTIQDMLRELAKTRTMLENDSLFDASTPDTFQEYTNFKKGYSSAILELFIRMNKILQSDLGPSYFDLAALTSHFIWLNDSIYLLEFYDHILSDLMLEKMQENMQKKTTMLAIHKEAFETIQSHISATLQQLLLGFPWTIQIPTLGPHTLDIENKMNGLPFTYLHLRTKGIGNAKAHVLMDLELYNRNPVILAKLLTYCLRMDSHERETVFGNKENIHDYFLIKLVENKLNSQSATNVVFNSLESNQVYFLYKNIIKYYEPKDRVILEALFHYLTQQKLVDSYSISMFKKSLDSFRNNDYEIDDALEKFINPILKSKGLKPIYTEELQMLLGLISGEFEVLMSKESWEEQSGNTHLN